MDAYLRRVVAQGAERARERAASTLAEVRHVMGIRKCSVNRLATGSLIGEFGSLGPSSVVARITFLRRALGSSIR